MGPPPPLFLWAKANFSPSSPSFLHVKLWFAFGDSYTLMVSPGETGNPLRANPGAEPPRGPPGSQDAELFDQ